MSEPMWIRKTRPHQLRIVSNLGRLRSRLVIGTYADHHLDVCISQSMAEWESNHIKQLVRKKK